MVEIPSSLILAVVKGGRREQDVWGDPGGTWSVWSCVGRFHVHNQGEGYRHRTDSRYTRPDTQRCAAPIAGALALIGGVVLLMAGRKA